MSPKDEQMAELISRYYRDDEAAVERLIAFAEMIDLPHTFENLMTLIIGIHGTRQNVPQA